MPSIRILQFAGLVPELSSKLKNKINAQVAHNCLLYNGELKAMPAFFKYKTTGIAAASLYRAVSPDGTNVVPDYDLHNALYLDGPPFPAGVNGIRFGASHFGRFIATKFGPPGVSGNLQPAGIGPPVVTNVTVTTTAMHQTKRPTQVSYAVTLYRLNGNSIEESAPTLLNVFVGTVGPTYFEGDAVALVITLAPFTSGETGVRLYRTISSLETGEQVVNTFDTEWHLVASIGGISQTTPIVTYTDVMTTQQLQGDVLLTKEFFSPFITSAPTNYGLTESGWLWYTTNNEIGFSERYMIHAWPPSGYLKLPNVDTIVGATTFYDDVFIGTPGKPYKVSISAGEDETVQVVMSPFPEVQGCVAGTMTTVAFGAMYASKNGLIALEENKMQVLTRDLLNAGSLLYKWCDPVLGEQEFHFADITHAMWFNGFYIGSAPNGKMFLYQPPEDLNDTHAFQELVTMDAPLPDRVPSSWVVGNYGLHVAYLNELFYWPIPGWVRPGDVPEKLVYKWKSKKFVMPGRTNFAAAKVVWKCDGYVCFSLFSDCIPVFRRMVTDCYPFRLPSEYIGVEFEIEVEGTGTISEIHVATSVTELTEVQTE